VRYIACMKNFRSECWILVGNPAGQELFCQLQCIWVDIIKADITLIVCDGVTRVICAPILRTDHFRLRCQKDQRASPRIRLMYEGWNFNSGNYLFTTDTK